MMQSSWLSFWLLKLCMIYPKDDIALESRNVEKSEDTGKKKYLAEMYFRALSKIPCNDFPVLPLHMIFALCVCIYLKPHTKQMTKKTGKILKSDTTTTISKKMMVLQENKCGRTLL